MSSCSGSHPRIIAETQLRADGTNRHARIIAELARSNRRAVPFNLIWLPGKNDPVILPELLTPSTVLDALKKG